MSPWSFYFHLGIKIPDLTRYKACSAASSTYAQGEIGGTVTAAAAADVAAAVTAAAAASAAAVSAKPNGLTFFYC